MFLPRLIRPRRTGGYPTPRRPSALHGPPDRYGASLVLSTSFGAQSAVMLHLATRIVPDIPVVFIDTGYLFPETYLFADLLTARLQAQPEGLPRGRVARMDRGPPRQALGEGRRGPRRLQPDRQGRADAAGALRARARAPGSPGLGASQSSTREQPARRRHPGRAAQRSCRSSTGPTATSTAT